MCISFIYTRIQVCATLGALRICDLMQLENWSIWYAAHIHTHTQFMCSTLRVWLRYNLCDFLFMLTTNTIALQFLFDNFNNIFSFFFTNSLLERFFFKFRNERNLIYVLHFSACVGETIVLKFELDFDLLIDQQFFKWSVPRKKKSNFHENNPNKSNLIKLTFVMFWIEMKRKEKNRKKISLKSVFTLLNIQTVDSDAW